MDLPAFLRSLSDPVPLWLLWLGSVIGHGFLATTGLNVLYSWPLNRKVLKFTRKIDILIVLAGPFLFLYSLEPWGQAGPDWDGYSARRFLAAYTVFCFVIGVTAAPIAQIAYWLRRTAPHLIKEEAHVIDVAKALGEPPAGRGKYHRLALLPWNQVFQVEFRTLTLAMPHLPASWEGLSILHLTDLHLCGTPDRDFYRHVLDRCMEEGTPDIVAVTGDVVDSAWHHRWILPLLGRLRWNIAGLAILGNHDFYRDPPTIRRRLNRAKLHVLGNGWQVVDVKGTPLLVVGHEGPWFTPPPDPKTWPAAAFKLCLSHTPDNFRWGRTHGIDLMLAGHVHGGQIRLPLIGSIFCPSRHSRRYDCGTFYAEPTLMHVSRGLAGQHPLRYRCRPEVTRIILTKGGAA